MDEYEIKRAVSCKIQLLADLYGAIDLERDLPDIIVAAIEAYHETEKKK